MNDQKRKIIEEYWLKKLSGNLQNISLPKFNDLNRVIKHDRVDYMIQVSDKITSNLNKISKGSDVAFFILALSGLNVALNKYTGIDDLVIGSMTPKKEANTSEVLLLRNQISVKLTFKEILNKTKQTVLEAFNYGDYSFEEMYHKLSYNQHSKLDIFNVALLYDKLHDIKEFPSKFEIVFILSNSGEELTLQTRYNPDLYSAEIIEYFCKNLLDILGNISSYLNQEVSMIKIVSQEEKKKLSEFNDTKIDYLKTKTIHELFEEQVQTRPDAIALIFEEKSLTYKELDEKSNQLAHILRGKGVQADSIIGIMVNRSLEMIVGILGVLKAGGAYLPVDPAYPLERIKFMLEDSDANILLTHNVASNSDKLKEIEFAGEIIDLTDQSLNESNKIKLEEIVFPDNLAYVIYTSGSTGKPKGVMIEHRNVVNFIKGITSKIDFLPNKTILALTTISFDIFVLETLVSLVKGLKIVIATEDQQNNLELLQELLKKHDVKMLQLTPSRLKLLMNSSEDLACFNGIEELMIGGEAFPEHVSTTLMNNFNGRIFNLYGQTEATVWSTLQEVIAGKEINIGTPIANTQIYILDENQNVKPIGVNGELCIAGEGLARGYLNNPELTQKQFIIKDGMRLYRTGDLARWNTSGEIEFLGRIDHQVKVRGFRIELGEIENILLSHDDINETVVTVVENPKSDKSLAAYYLSQKAFNISDLRAYLLKKLPEYMIPSYFVKLDTIPLTPNGKVDRKALPDPNVQVEKKYVAPRDELEEKIVEIWSEVLGVDYDSIGIDTNFFELGGHSLSAFQIISKIQKFINVMITIPNFFGSPTIRQLALVIRETEKTEFIDLEKIEEKEYYPISYNQRRLWILYQLEPESPAYNLPGRMELKSQVNVEWIKKALTKIMDRHESFRTGFKTIDGELVQFIVPAWAIEVPLEIMDISSLNASEKQQKRQEINLKVARTIFDLSKAPLFKAVLLKVDEEFYELIFNMHHIIADGWSLEILQREFFYHYAGYSRGEEVELEPVVYQYKDFAVWHNKQLNNQKIKEKSHQFWKKKLESGFPILELPRDFERTFEQSKKSAGYRCVVNKEVKDRLRKLASENNTTLFMVMFSGFNVLLSYLSGQQEIVSGIASAGRDHISLQNIVGYFTNSIIQKTSVDYQEPFREFLYRVDKETQDTFQHQSYPLELVLDDLKMRYPEISVLFNMLNMIENSNLEELDSLDSYHIPKLQDGKFELELYVIEYKNGIEINWNYRNSLFKPETMEYIVKEYLKLLNEISVGSDKQICEYNTCALKDIEIKGNLIKPTNSFIEFKGEYQSIIGRFNEQVTKYPDQIAVKTINKILSYYELNLLSNQIGRMILDKSNTNLEGIALLFEHDAEMIAGMLGTLKSGKYYIPLDPTYPINRLTYMLKDSDAKIILTNATNKLLAETLISEIEKDITIINVNAIEPSISGENLNIYLDPENIAYILYTSGSTGTPKGVIQNHKNVLHFIRVYTNNLQINSNDRLTLLSSYSFDAAVMDIYGALFNGATLYPYNLKEGDLSSFASWLQDERITIYHSIPTVYRYVIDELTGNEDLSDLRLIVLGGEAVNRRDVAKYKEYFSDNCLFINGLGPTESTVTLQFFIDKQTKLGSKAVPVGFPVDETEVYLLDENNDEARVFGIGELVFKSDYLALGYLNNPAKTNEVFVSDPITKEGRVYRTGDLGRRLLDGSIEFIGRRDFQTKIRGYRIEPGEVEDKILNHPEVNKAVVMAREGNDGNRYLCAYVVAGNEVEVLGLREKLALELPDYMIPSYFVKLNKLPLTSTGKVDRKALPEVDITKSGVEYIAPISDVEKNLVNIWAEVLDIAKEKIGVYHNFFELGGHSLKATKVISNIHKELNVKISLAEFFRRPTIRGLAEYILRAAEESYTSIEVADQKDNYAVSSAQKRLYILQQLTSEGTGYNISTVLRLKGTIHRDKFESVFRELINRHESLRTSFANIDGEIVQIIHPIVDFAVEYYESKEEEAKTIISNFIRPFDQEKAPLMRAGLIEVAQDDHILMVDMHHIISDGTSVMILVKDFMSLYAGEELPKLMIQYKDYAEWQNSKNGRESIIKQEEYWLQDFAAMESQDGIPVLNLPTDYTRPLIQSFAGSSLTFKIEKEVVDQLKELALKENASLYMVLLAIYNVFLAKLSGQEEIIVGTPVAGRRHVEFSEIIGVFINTLALRNNPKAEKGFLEFLGEVSERTLKAFENQEYQFEDLVEKIDVNRDVSRNPLFDVLFILQNMDRPEIDISGLKLSHYSFKRNISKFDLSLSGIEVDGELRFTFEYSTKLFKEETIRRFTKYYKQILRFILETPEKRISEIEILLEEEKRQILYELNDTETEYLKDKTIHELFEEQVKRSPDNIAVVFEDKQLTYRELNQQADQLANILFEKGIQIETIVGLLVDRSIEMIVGILGILKAGGAYLPIDPDYPVERIQFTLEDSGAEILLTKTFLQEKVEFDKEIICLDESTDIAEIKTKTPMTVSAYNIAYIIYTSGSTGKPKGVMIEHRSVNNFIEGVTQKIDFASDQTILSLTTISFDIFVLETLLPLTKGLKVVIANEEEQISADLLSKTLVANSVDLLQLTPSRLQLLLNSEEGISGLRNLKTIMIGGEAFPTKLFAKLQSLTKTKIYNMYGPTETTVWSTIQEIKDINEINIGKPIANTQVYILDKNLKVVPKNVVGELYIAGDGLARGYLNNPELTIQRFIENPFAKGERMYKTGDLVSWNSDGEIEFIGRVDDQVKIRGYRIELGEIESILLRHPNIDETVVIARTDHDNNKYLCAYFVSDVELTIEELRGYLKKDLPVYMIPSFFVQLEQIPLTPNGKVNRKALPEVDKEVINRAEYFPPTNEIEELLAQIWSSILGIEKISIYDKFFELGGHSLKATALMSQIHKELNVQISLREIFLRPTIKEMSQYIRDMLNTRDKIDYYSIAKVEELVYYPLSSSQQSIFIYNQKVDNTIDHNIPSIYAINGEFNKERFKEAIKKLASRHESLRTSFEIVKGEPAQIIHQDIDVNIQYLKAKNCEVQNVIKEFIKPFDLGQAPLFWVGLLETEDKKLLLSDMHHIISDEVSSKIFISDFEKIYEGESLPELQLQYTDYVTWQSEQLESGIIKDQEKYWLETFAKPVTPLNLPADYQRVTGTDYNGDTVNFSFNSELTIELEQLATENGVTADMVILAIYNIFLLRYANSEDVVVGTPIAGRVREDFKKIIGVFENTLALRNYPKKDKTFVEFLNEVKENTLMAYDNQEYQYEMLLTRLDIIPDMSRNPLFDVMFEYLNNEQSEEEIKELRFTPYQFKNTIVKYDLTLYGQKVQNELQFTFRYRMDLFKKETVQKLSERFIEIAKEVIGNPEIKISKIESISDEKKQELLLSFNDDLDDEWGA